MRVRRVNEESNSTRREVNTDQEVSEQVDEQEQQLNLVRERYANDAFADEVDLRSCVVCKRDDIKPEEFRSHVTTQHKSYINGTPEGYYGCWSGQEFWFPLKFATGPCKWLCSVCGSTKYYFGKGNTHGGPTTRLVDRRYALAYCEEGRYPKHKRAYGKIGTSAGPVIFMHEGAPNPEQPDNSELEKQLNEASVLAKADRKTGTKRVTKRSRSLPSGDS